MRHLAYQVVKNLKIVEDHENIITAVKARQANVAADLMDHHLERYKIDAAVIDETFPHYIKKDYIIQKALSGIIRTGFTCGCKRFQRYHSPKLAFVT